MLQDTHSYIHKHIQIDLQLSHNKLTLVSLKHFQMVLVMSLLHRAFTIYLKTRIWNNCKFLKIAKKCMMKINLLRSVHQRDLVIKFILKYKYKNLNYLVMCDPLQLVKSSSYISRIQNLVQIIRCYKLIASCFIQVVLFTINY